MQYFNHDTSAGDDPKIVALRLEHGGAAVDAYWCIVELVYRDESPLVFFGNRLGTKAVSHRLCTDEKQLEEWVQTMLDLGLLKRCGEDGNSLTSDRIDENMSDFVRKAEIARQNGKKGGRKTKRKPSANPAGTQSVSDEKPRAKLIKENKRVGFDKQNQPLSVPPVAAAADAAPDETQLSTGLRCRCGGLYAPDRESGTFRLSCPDCGAAYEPAAGADPQPSPAEPPAVYAEEVPF